MHIFNEENLLILEGLSLKALTASVQIEIIPL
jgi:hypothetical protein